MTKYYNNTVSEWIAALQVMEAAGKGDEKLALGFWTKEQVEFFLKESGYPIEMTDEQWNYYATKTEDSWTEFGEDDVDFAVMAFDLDAAEEEEG